jgi:hypothetical protein
LCKAKLGCRHLVGRTAASTPGAGGGEAGPDTLLNEIPLELRQSGENAEVSIGVQIWL